MGLINDIQQRYNFLTINKLIYRIEKPCPDTFNPGDHFIFTLAIKSGQEDDCRAYVHTVCDIFK